MDYRATRSVARLHGLIIAEGARIDITNDWRACLRTTVTSINSSRTLRPRGIDAEFGVETERAIGRTRVHRLAVASTRFPADLSERRM